MKKFTKFLGIFLALSMVIGMLSVVGAVDPETPTAPAAPTGAIKQGTVLEVVSPTKLETVFGYYEENAIDNPDAFIDCQDGACVTDGWFSRAGYSECTLDDGTIGLIMTIDEVTALGGIEIVGKNAANCPTEFTVEALVDGAWVVVLSGSNFFSTGLTQMFTFDTVETDTVRIIVTAVAEEGEQCYFNEVTLFTPKTGNLKTVIDMNGKAIAGDAHASSNNNWAIDGDKSTFFTGSTVTVGLGEATAIDGFNLYHYRNSSFPNNITVNIQKTEDGAFETIGTFATGFTAGSPQDSLYVTFDQTYMAYAVQFVSDVWGYQNDYELWQYDREASAEEPTPAPTEEPTPAPTEEPTPAPTAPTEEPTPTEPAATLQKIDLTGTVVGVDSQDSASKTDFTTFTWYSDANPDWKDISIPVNGRYDDEIHWGLDPHERADIYLDLTRINADGVAASQLKLYHSQYRAVPSLTVILKLADGTFVEKVFELNWEQDVAADPLVYTFDETYTVAGVYLWENENVDIRATFGEIELYSGTATEPEQPTEPTEPETQPTEPTVIVGPDGVVNEIVLGALSPVGSMGIVPQFGYYDNAEMIGSVIDHQAAPGEDACLVDGNTGNSGWTGNIAFADLVDNGGVKVPVILLDLGAATTVGGIELISVDSSCSAPTHFEVQVTTSADSDVWETVLTAENVTWDRTETKQFAFDRTVDAYKVRLVVYNLSALGEATETQFALHELTLMSAQEVPKVDKTPLSGSNVLQFGYFADLELTDYRDSVLSNNVPGNLFDGNSGSLAITNTEAWTWGSGAGMAANGGTNTAVLTLDVTQNGEPTAINYMQMVVQGQYRYAPTTYTLQVTTSATEDNWTTVYEVTDFSWEDNGTSDHYVTFDEVSAYKVRLLVAKTHVDQNNLCYFGMGEFVLGTVEIVDIPDDPTDPTDPTTPSEPEPTAPSEPEPTAPAETVPALPEAPVVLPGTTTIAGGIVKEGDVYKMVSPKSITTGFGYYDANGAFVDKNDGYCVTDGWYGRAGYSECTTADGQMALIMTLAETKAIGRVEIVGRYPENNPVDFEIQALVDGEWVTVTDVNEDPFTTGMTVAFTFPAVATNQVRILINAVGVATNVCHLNEVELYEVTTGKLYNKINLVGTSIATDAHESAPVVNLTDGDKAPYFLGANATFNLTDADGNPTSIDAISLFMYRGNQAFPSTVNVMIQKTAGGEFESIGVFATNWTTGYPQDRLFAEFDQTYDAYGIQLNLDTYAYVAEFELFQYEKEPAPVVPEDPTEPSEPTEPSTPADPTEPSTPAEPTEPSVPAEPTEPEETPTEPTVPSEPTDEPILPGEELDLTELEATFALLEGLDPEDYTEESALAVDEAILIALMVMADENCTQEMIDEANALLLEAINNLVLIEESGTDEPGTDLPDVPELPGAVDIAELQATIDLIHSLNPNKYTADSYAELIAAVKEVNKMIAYGPGYTQAVIDKANDMLATALDNLVLVDGGTDTPDDGETDSDLPADTGDIALTVMTAMMTMSAVGGAVVIGKKKFF